MGLDTYLTAVKILTDVEKMCINLGSGDEEREDICYWRKDWDIVTIFMKVLGKMKVKLPLENVTDYPITKKQLEEAYKLSKDEQIKEALKKINWKTHKVFFYNWW